jgi:tetratricopeptide (TPR) repeat protein
MKFGRANSFPLLQSAFLLASLLVLPVWADEYSDVSQLIKSGKLVQAQAMVDRAIAAKPRDPQMRFFKGVIQRDMGRPADAINTFTKLTEEFPELPEPYNNLAVIYASQSQFDKARAALEQAIRTNPSYATAHENLGDVYAKLASQAYNKALQIDAGNTAVAPKLALIRELFNPVPPKSRPATPVGTTPTVVAATTPITAPVTKPFTVAPAASASATAAPSSATLATKPAVVVPTVPAASGVPEGPSKAVEAAVIDWAKAWSDKNMSVYLAAYGKDFVPPNNQSRAAWEEDRRLRITSKSKISVNLLSLSITVNGTHAVAKFQQDYKADALAVLSRKTLEMVQTGERWQIVKESTGN